MIATLSFTRNYFNYGTETDFLGGFVSEAERVLNGDPLHLDFHPPLYPVLLACVKTLFSDWFLTGLTISFFCSLVVLAVSFLFFHKLYGGYAAWGSLLALMTSTVFVSYSAQATSDLFFVALFYIAFFVGYLAMEGGGWKMWLVTGLVVGCALLTRSNSLTLLSLSALPFMQKTSWNQKIRSMCFILVGLMFPILLWVGAAKVTGSPLMPSGNHVNLALTYFSPSADRISGDARRHVETKFESVVDVISYDPKHLIITYVKDLYDNLKRIFNQNSFIPFPFNLFALPGVLILCLSTRRSWHFIFIVSVLLQIALVNFKAFEARYYMFIIPFLGAGVGMLIHYLIELSRSTKFNIALSFCMLLLFFVAEKNVINDSYVILHSSDDELNEVLPAAQIELNQHVNSDVIARKPHLGYYLPYKTCFLFPQVETMNDLGKALESMWHGGTLNLFYGSAELRNRPGLSELRFGKKTPGWLQVVAKSKNPGSWVLYRYLPESSAGKGLEIGRMSISKGAEKIDHAARRND
jgi:hypothetical protein